IGSAWNVPPVRKSMPTCAPVEGSPSPAINGHTPPTCSEVIRYTASGAGTAHQPAARPLRPRLPTIIVNGSLSLTGSGGGHSGGDADTQQRVTFREPHVLVLDPCRGPSVAGPHCEPGPASHGVGQV